MLAPEMAERIWEIVGGLTALVLRRFFATPRLLPLAMPLLQWLGRFRRRFKQALVSPVVQRVVPRVRASRAGRVATEQAPGGQVGETAAKPVQIPQRLGWLLAELRHEAGFYTAQVEALLHEPGAAGLLAEHPVAMRILRRLARMLDVRVPAAGVGVSAVDAAAAAAAMRSGRDLATGRFVRAAVSGTHSGPVKGRHWIEPYPGTDIRFLVE